MPVLCNDADRCEVMNLAWGPNGHGPYLVRQEGYEPGSSQFKPQRFILQKGCDATDISGGMLSAKMFSAK
ncbi:MAG: hypothetical protein IPK32_19175 [Verrucomicrobiaceae bacterium]|nr:hypothetical protein [Verrucomicrobiaceae bacterium]